MKKYQLVKNEKYSSFLIYLLIINSIYFGRDTLVSTAWLNFFGCQLLILLFVILYTILFIVNNKSNILNIIFDVRFIFLLITSLLFLLIMILKRDFTLMYLSCIIAIYFSVFLSYILNIKQFLKIFTNVILIFTAFSLIVGYLLRPLIFSNVESLMITENSVGLQFINCIGTFLVNDPGYLRNFGIFREPGIFQFFLTVALIFEIFLIKRNNVYKRRIFIFILLIGSLTTFSTTGMIQLILIFFATLIENIRKICFNKIKVLLGFIFFFIIFGILFYLVKNNNNLYWTIWQMFSKFSNLNESLVSRFSSIKMNISFFLKNPILGNDISLVLYSINNTNSSLLLFACYGLLIGTIFNYCWLFICNGLYLKTNNKVTKILIILVFLISINTQNLTTNFYFYSIPIISLFEQKIMIIFNNIFNSKKENNK